MLNNGHMSGGMPDGPPPGHPMYGHHHGGGGGGGGGGPGDYGGNPNTFLGGGGPSPPGSMNGMSGTHHSGGYCSQMTLNQNNPSGPAHCHYCGHQILDRYYLQAMNRFWHHSCLKCSQCNATLADIGRSCFEREGMLLCRNDYYRMYGQGAPGGACQGCGQVIPATELVMRAGVSPPGSAPPFVYHLKCFTCSKCHCSFTPGDRYSVLNGTLYCEQDAIKLMKNGIGSPSNANVAPTANGPAPRKGKVGRPRRSRD